MNWKSLLFCACFASLLSSTPAAPVIKILHINPQAKVRAIWQESAQGFESTHPGAKVEFDYLENEAFKAKLPTLLQSKDRPSIFHSWGSRQPFWLRLAARLVPGDNSRRVWIAGEVTRLDIPGIRIRTNERRNRANQVHRHHGWSCPQIRMPCGQIPGWFEILTSLSQPRRT